MYYGFCLGFCLQVINNSPFLNPPQDDALQYHEGKVCIAYCNTTFYWCAELLRCTCAVRSTSSRRGSAKVFQEGWLSNHKRPCFFLVKMYMLKQLVEIWPNFVFNPF